MASLLTMALAPGSIAALLATALLMGATGCGEFVRYEPGSGGPQQAPDAGLPPAIPAPDGLQQRERLDHADWDALLSQFVNVDAEGFARVDYASLLADSDATSRLETYLDLVADIDPGALADGDERLAFYINAYNASVVRSVLIASASDPQWNPDQDDFALFGRPEHLVAGVRLTLDQLEHAILRGDFLRDGVTETDSQTLGRIRFMHEALRRDGPLDARIHMALNCAALSCPNLQPSAYQGGELDAQLRQASAAFLENTDKGAGPAGISSLFRPDWFEADFVASFGSVSEFIAQERPGGLSEVALDSFLNYDWTLNALR